MTKVTMTMKTKIGPKRGYNDTHSYPRRQDAVPVNMMVLPLDLPHSSKKCTTSPYLKDGWPANTTHGVLKQLLNPSENIERTNYVQWGAWIAQWWEHSPPTSAARVRFPDSASYVGWVCCWFLSLVFLRVFWFSLRLKINISKFQFWGPQVCQSYS